MTLGSAILLTNIVFSGRSGTEVATLELARALRGRGHLVAIFSLTLGQIALEARASGIPVTDSVAGIGFVPEIIHGNHNIPLLLALVGLRSSRAVFVCHDSASPYDEPVLHSRIKRYVAVDAACQARLIFDGVPPELITIIPNGVALDLYTTRTVWARTPAKALLVVKQRTEHVAVVEEACRRCGVALEIVGAGVNKVVSDLPRRYLEADIVFAHSRSALEAAATGACVVIIDEYGYGGTLGTNQITEWPETSLSRRILKRTATLAELCRDISDYSKTEAQQVCALIREHTDLERLTGQWEAVYQQALDAQPAEAPHDDTNLARFLQRVLPNRFDISAVEQASRRNYDRAEMADLLASLIREVREADFGQLPFHKSAMGLVLLDDGWYPPDDTKVWSAGGVVSLWLPAALIEAWEGDFVFECFRYIPCSAADDKTYTVRLEIDRQWVADWTFRRNHHSPIESRRLAIPLAVRPPPGGAIKLAFYIGDAVSPLEGGDSQDQRVLGLALVRMRRPDPAPPGSERELADDAAALPAAAGSG